MKSFIEFTKLEDRGICNYFVKDLKLKTKKDWENVLKDFSKDIFKVSVFFGTLESKEQINKFLNEVLKISSPESNIRINKLDYGIENGKIRIKFNLIWELEPGIFLGSGEDSCFWHINYNPSAILDFRVCQYFNDGIVLRIVDVSEKDGLWYTIGNKHNTIFEIMEYSKEYYKMMYPGFSEFIKNFRSGSLNKVIEDWKVNEFVGLNNFSAYVLGMGRDYGWLVGSGITNDFSFVIGSWVYDFYYRSKKSIMSVLKEDLLSDPGYPTIAMEKAWIKLDEFKRKYIDPNGEYQSFVKTVSEAQERIREFTKKVSEETGIHPDFLAGLWRIKDVPVDISQGVEYNMSEILKNS